MGYFFLLRRSEYLKVDGKWFPYVLQLGDLRFYDSNEDECPAHVAKIVGIKLKGARTINTAEMKSDSNMQQGIPYCTL